MSSAPSEQARPPCTVFYSWQSDLPNKTNRSFIGEALKAAIKTLARDMTVKVQPTVDRDTAGAPGAPDIARTIFDKIAQATAVVADVSIVSRALRARSRPAASSKALVAAHTRPTPNPNVLIEVGYAAHALGWDRIILVVNEAAGSREILPFDLRSRRICPYTMFEAETNRARERGRLSGILADGLREILATGLLSPLRIEPTFLPQVVDGEGNPTSNSRSSR